MSVYERLEALNIALPRHAPPVAAFVPFLRSGNLIFLAGHIAKLDGQPWVGQGRGIGGSDGTRIRDLLRDRQAVQPRVKELTSRSSKLYPMLSQ